MQERIQRRLAAIVAADVAGYSRLIGQDEEGTLAALQLHRRDLIDPLIASHGGRIANTAGDSILMEFPSAVEAIRCSVAIQDGLKERNEAISEHRRIQFRIGVNVGDVVPDGEDLLGDGVNIAARLEALAPVGGICLSRSARDQVRDRLDIAFDDLGEITVKNIARPVRVFRIDAQMPNTADLVDRSSPPDSGIVQVFPSIAVLPFNNLSGDPEQEYFAEGISEDIITELARFPDLIVIARNSTFTYKGSATKIQDISKDLDARYILEGSVRRSGNRVRITAQLVDGQTADQVWAERYDRDLTDIFDVQDEITQTVVANVPERIAKAELSHVKRKLPEDLSAYEFVLRGKRHHHKCTSEDNAEALRLLDAAIECDPQYASAYAWKACTLGQALGLGCGEPKDLITRNLDTVRIGLSLDENDIECHRILAEFGMYYGNWDDAERHHAKAFQLNPNDPRIITQRGELLTKLGQAEEGLDWLRKATRVDPYAAPDRAHLLARAHFAAHHYEEAVIAYKQIPVPRPDHLAELAACYAMQDQMVESDACAESVCAANPSFSIFNYTTAQKFKGPSDLEHLRGALRRTKLPD